MGYLDCLTIGVHVTDRGLFSRAVPIRQTHIINLDGARHHRRLIQGKIIVARPSPILRALHQPSAHGIPMQIVKPSAELLFVAHEAVPELMLPYGTLVVGAILSAPASANRTPPDQTAEIGDGG